MRHGPGRGAAPTALPTLAATGSLITRVRLSLFRVPLAEPVSGAKVATGRQRPLGDVDVLVARISSDDGLEGLGFVINLVPALPFVILVMTPFIEQLNPTLESAARMLGANPRQLFRRILLPLIIPGMLTAALLVVVRTMGMFELTFLVSGADTQTLVVGLYTAVFAAGIRPQQAVDAMAVVYMLTTLTMLVVALRFVSPTQMVFRVKE